MFGFGKNEKKKKTPFRIPPEASALSTIIDAENRENYPKPARYQEIAKQVKMVFDQLDAYVAEGEHAAEATRIKEDLKKKIRMLTEKVNKNKQAAKKEGSEDYVASNMEYLERKGMRNQAKTLYTEFLVDIESVMKWVNEDRFQNAATAEPSIEALLSTMEALNNNYFRKYREDKEIRTIREELLKKIEGLNDYFDGYAERLKELGLDVIANSVRAKIAMATRKISEQ